MTTFGTELQRVRRNLYRHVTQSDFADRFGLTYGVVKDAEQDRVKPSRALRVLVAAIDLDPEFVDRAVLLAAERERVERGSRKHSAQTCSRARGVHQSSSAELPQ